jgi:hypothetical protein
MDRVLAGLEHGFIEDSEEAIPLIEILMRRKGRN